MNNERNLQIYRRWALIYDVVMRPVYGGARRRALELLKLQPSEDILVDGIGTGLDLPLIPEGVKITGIDLSAEMLAKARAKRLTSDLRLMRMDAQALDFRDESFDAIILNLILSVAPDGARAFQEAWRVLRRGGRAVIFDKFLPEGDKVSALRKVLGKILQAIGTDPNRKLSDILGQGNNILIERNEPSLLAGQYRIVLLRKKEKV